MRQMKTNILKIRNQKFVKKNFAFMNKLLINLNNYLIENDESDKSQTIFTKYNTILSYINFF